MSGLAERIQERLAATGKTARGASLEAGLGPDAIRIILDGRSVSPRLATITKLADALECDVAYLAGMDSRTPLAQRLVRQMAAKGLNPFSTAEAAGLKRDYVRNILRGKSDDPGAASLAKVAAVLGVTPAWLIGEAEPSTEAVLESQSPPDVPQAVTMRPNGRVALKIDANVSMGVASKILALIEGDKP